MNGRILTGQGQVEALTVRAGRVVAVGSTAELASGLASSTEVIDVGGRTVIPGLIDSHLHVARAGQTWHQTVDWTRVDSVEDALGLLSEKANRLPEGTWVSVWGGWHPGQFREQRPPTCEELTAAVPNYPVYVQFLYEEAYLNRAGLEACGVRTGEPDPNGGWFERRATGEPTGLLRGRKATDHCVATIGLSDFDTLVSSTAGFLSHLASFGMTGVIDPGGRGMTPDQYRPLYRVWEQRSMAVRVRILLSNTSAPAGKELEWTREYLRHHYPGYGDAMLAVAGIGEKLTAEYSDGEGLTEHRIGEEGPAKLAEISRLLAEEGWPVHLHAIRPDVVASVLDVWEALDRDLPLRSRRFALAHADAISAADVARVARIGVGVAVQDRLVFRSAESAKAWGSDVAHRAPPLRSMLQAGIPLGGGTDGTNVTTYDPWLSIWWMVTGQSLDEAPPRHEEERLSRDEALAVYTSGSAWFSCEEDRRGRLLPGYWADLAVLSDHYLDVSDDSIRELRSLLTMVGGKVTHEES